MNKKIKIVVESVLNSINEQAEDALYHSDDFHYNLKKLSNVTLEDYTDTIEAAFNRHAIETLPTLTELKLLLDWTKNANVEATRNWDQNANVEVTRNANYEEQVESKRRILKMQLIYDRECKKLINELAI